MEFVRANLWKLCELVFFRPNYGNGVEHCLYAVEPKGANLWNYMWVCVP